MVCVSAGRREITMAAAGRGGSSGMCSSDRWEGAYLDSTRRNSLDNHTGTNYFTVLNLCGIWAITEN